MRERGEGERRDLLWKTNLPGRLSGGEQLL